MKCYGLLRMLAVITTLSGMLTMDPQRGNAQTGVVIVAHGSPSPRWNQAIADVVDRVRDRLANEPGIAGVRLGYLEMAKPSIAEAVSDLTAQGCRRIVAVPMFIAASGHVQYDVPVVLGVLHDPKVARALEEEGITLVRPEVPITLTPPLSEGRSLDEFTLSEVERLSQEPTREVLLLLLHGDDDFQPKLDALARRVIEYVQQKVGLSAGEWCYIGVGQGYGTKAIPKMEQALARGQRVLVVALFAASSAQQFHERWVQQETGGRDLFKGRDVVFSDQTLTQHPALLEDLINFAREAIRRNSGN